MYNRYIPNGASYTRVVEEDAPPTPVSYTHLTLPTTSRV